MATPVTVSTQSVPSSFCPSNIATDWPFLVSLISASLGDEVSLFNFSESTPAPADEGKPWIRLNADGTPDRMYVFASGSWLSKHPMAPGIVTIYTGTEGSITTFDGGEAGTVTKVSGPMWEKVSAMDARVPVGVGTLPTSSTNVTVTGTGGEDEHSLHITTAQLPAHVHRTGIDGKGISDDVKQGRTRVGAGTELSFSSTNNSGQFMETHETGDGDAVVFDNMPPYYGVFFIKRTLREYYRV